MNDKERRTRVSRMMAAEREDLAFHREISLRLRKKKKPSAAPKLPDVPDKPADSVEHYTTVDN